MSLIEARAAADRARDEYRSVAHPGIDDWQRANAAQNALHTLLSQPLDRVAYERQCEIAGVEAYTDAEIQRASYTLTYFDMPADPARWIEIGLARQRLHGLQAERPVQPALAPATAACQGCGTQVPAGVLMNASTRVGVCPDCYDRYS